MKKVRILHCADLHLGSEFSALSGKKLAQRKTELLTTLHSISSLVKEQSVQLVFVAGDLFESWNIGEDVLHQVRDVFAELAPIKIFISAGNHDPITPNSPYETKEFWSSNVHIFSHTLESILCDDLKTEVHGASFASPYQNDTLLTSITPQNSDYIQIGVLHGMVGTHALQSEYNPLFKDSIAASGLDYLALGHIHEFSGIWQGGKTFYAYSGCPEGRGFDELDSKGVLIGDVLSGSHTLEFFVTCKRMYLEETVDITGLETSSQVSGAILTALKEKHGDEYDAHLYKIILTGYVHESARIDLAGVQSGLSTLFFVKLRDRSAIEIDLELAIHEQTLRGFFLQNIEAEHKNNKHSEELLETARTLGIRAMQGEVEYYED